MTQAKQCRTCGIEKQLEEYSKAVDTKDKRRSECKACSSVRAVEWARANREKKRASLRRYYSKNASKFKTYNGTVAWAKRLLKNADLSSKVRNLGPVTIDEAWILEQPMVCYYTQMPLVPSADKSLWQPSLDRINNAKGYTPENTRLTSLGWNLLRNDLSIERALSFVSHLRAQT